MKKISIVLIVIFTLLGCEKSSSEIAADGSQELKEPGLYEADIENQFPEYIDVEVSDVDNAGFRYPYWDGVLDERGFDPLNSVYPNGPVKELFVKSDLPNGELTLYKKYDLAENVLQKRTYAHGDESGWNYIYDEFSRLVRIEESINGTFIPERHLLFSYHKYDSEKNSISREVFKNGELLRVETETFKDDTISLKLDYPENSKKYDTLFTLTFLDGNITKSVQTGEYKKTFEFEYNGDLLVKSKESSSMSDKFLYIKEFNYNEKKHLIECIFHDQRKTPSEILRKELAYNHDQYGNWIRREWDYNGEVEDILYREISYYD